MRLLYAILLCAGFNLHWVWYALSVAVWLAGKAWLHYGGIGGFIATHFDDGEGIPSELRKH